MSAIFTPMTGRKALPALLVILTALPVLFLRIPPMVDVLGHVGRYQLQTGLQDHPWWQTFYAYEWQIIGNLGADLLVQALHPLLGVLGATRFAVVLVPLLMACAVLLLSHRMHGRITPFAVLALTLVYALPFTWGFLNFSLAMACTLLAFSLWLYLRPTRTRAMVFIVLSLAIWLCHTFGWAFLGILCASETLVRRGGDVGLRRWTAALGDVLPLVVPLVPMLIWRSTAAGAGVDGWFDLVEKAQWIASILRLEWEAADRISAVVLLAAILFGVLSRRVVLDQRLGLAAALSFAAFLLMPRQIFGSVFADMRLAPYVVMLALLAMRQRGQADSRLALTCALAFLAFRVALTAHVYHEREQAIDRELVALRAIPEHARIAMLVEIPCQDGWTMPWYSHLGSLALLQREVFVNDQWANQSMNPLQVRLAAAGSFAADNRQLFTKRRCGPAPSFAEAFSALPARAFTHVWIVGPTPEAIPPRADLIRVWRSAHAAVFRVSEPVTVEDEAH